MDIVRNLNISENNTVGHAYVPAHR
jgi:hypothetical protein